MNDAATLSGIAMMCIVVGGFVGALCMLDVIGSIVYRWLR